MSWMRHTAVVLAGAGSVAFTGAAASVVVSGLEFEPNFDIPVALPPVQPGAPGPLTGNGGGRSIEKLYDPAVTDPAPVEAVLVAATDPAVPPTAPIVVDPVTTTPQPAAPAQPARREYGGTLQVNGVYLGAAVAPVRVNVVGVDVKTNILDLIPRLLGLAPIDASTLVRTELDLRRGGINVNLTDTFVGQHSVNIERKPAA